MSKSLSQDPWKQLSAKSRKGGERRMHGHDADAAERLHGPAKSHKAYGIRQDEAQRQIRELQSRY